MATLQDLLTELTGGSPDTSNPLDTSSPDTATSDTSTNPMNEALSSLATNVSPASFIPDIISSANAAEPSYKTPSADAINASQKALGSGVTVTTLPNGQLMFTNTPVAGTQVNGVNSNVPSGPGTPTFNLQQRIKDISAIKDPQEAFNQFATLHGDASTYLANLKQNAVDKAGKLYDLPSLEEQLAQREAADKASPYYHIFLTDSPLTAKLREQVDTARKNAEQQGNEFFARNPEVASISDTLKTIGAKQLTMLQQNIQDQSKDAEKKDFLTASISPAMVSTYLAANPGVANNYDPTKPDQEYQVKRQTFLAYQTNPAFKEAADAMGTNNPSSLLTLVQKDNPFARAVLTQSQVQALSKGDPTGADIKGQQQVNTLFDLVNSPSSFNTALNTDMPVMAKKVQNEITAAGKQLTGKDKLAAERDVRIKYANQILSTQTANNFLGSIDGTNWGSAYDALQRDPVLSTVYAAARAQNAKGNSNPTVSLPDMLAQIKATPNIDVPQTIKNLQQIATTAYDKTNTGLVGKGSQLDFNSTFNKQIAHSIMLSINPLVLGPQASALGLAGLAAAAGYNVLKNTTMPSIVPSFSNPLSPTKD